MIILKVFVRQIVIRNRKKCSQKRRKIDVIVLKRLGSMPRPILSSVEVLEKNLGGSKVQNLIFLEIFKVSDPGFSRIKIQNIFLRDATSKTIIMLLILNLKMKLTSPLNGKKSYFYTTTLIFRQFSEHFFRFLMTICGTKTFKMIICELIRVIPMLF